MNKKNLTQTKLEELNLEKVQVEKQLAIWTEKLNKAEEYFKVLYETRKFTMDFWVERITAAESRVKKDAEKDLWWLEHEIGQRTEFDIYYQALDLFKEEIVKRLKEKESNSQMQLWSIENEITKLQNRLNRPKTP